MKNLIIIILVSLFSISATIAVQNVTVTPSKPKSLVCKSFIYGNQVPTFIEYWTTKGYILKSCSGSSYWVVVMEKY